MKKLVLTALLATATVSGAFSKEVALRGSFSADHSGDGATIDCGPRDERCGEWDSVLRTFRDANNHTWTNVDCSGCQTVPVSPSDPGYNQYLAEWTAAFYYGGITADY